MKNRLAFILLIALGVGFSAQGQLNAYKYIIVPKKFDAFKAENQYQTSTLVKHYLSEHRLTAVYDDSLPMELAGNRCMGLMANLLDESSMFTTKVVLTLKNCQNQEVFRTREGKSKTKEFEPAYREAIQEALGSFAGIAYEYRPQETETIPRTSIAQNNPDTEQKVPAAVSQSGAVEQKSTLEEQTYKSVEPRASNVQRGNSLSVGPNLDGILYAQAIEGGYQLVDNAPQIVLKLEGTSMDNIFLTQYGGHNAMVFKKGDNWYLEYVENGQKMTKELQIKF